MFVEKKSNYAIIKLAATTSEGRKNECRLKMLLCCRTLSSLAGKVDRQNEKKLVNNTGSPCLGELVALLESSSFTYSANLRFKLRISQNRK